MILLDSLPSAIVAAARRGPKAVQAAIAAAGGSPVRSDEMVTLFHVGVADSVTVRHWLDIFPAIPELSPVGDDRIWATPISALWGGTTPNLHDQR